MKLQSSLLYMFFPNFSRNEIPLEAVKNEHGSHDHPSILTIGVLVLPGYLLQNTEVDSPSHMHRPEMQA